MKQPRNVLSQERENQFSLSWVCSFSDLDLRLLGELWIGLSLNLLEGIVSLKRGARLGAPAHLVEMQTLRSPPKSAASGILGLGALPESQPQWGFRTSGHVTEDSCAVISKAD